MIVYYSLPLDLDGPEIYHVDLGDGVVRPFRSLSKERREAALAQACAEVAADNRRFREQVKQIIEAIEADMAAL